MINPVHFLSNHGIRQRNFSFILPDDENFYWHIKDNFICFSPNKQNNNNEENNCLFNMRKTRNNVYDLFIKGSIIRKDIQLIKNDTNEA